MKTRIYAAPAVKGLKRYDGRIDHDICWPYGIATQMKRKELTKTFMMISYLTIQHHQFTLYFKSAHFFVHFEMEIAFAKQTRFTSQSECILWTFHVSV